MVSTKEGCASCKVAEKKRGPNHVPSQLFSGQQQINESPKVVVAISHSFSFFQANPFNFTHTLAVCGTFITAPTPHFSCHIDAVGVSGFPTPPISSERDEPLGQFYRFQAPAELYWAFEAQYQPWKGGVPRLKEARAREISSAIRSFYSYREGKKRKET